MSYENLMVPPHDIAAEQAVLGAFIVSGMAKDERAAWSIVQPLLDEEDFYRHDNRLIFRAISALITDGKPTDMVTVEEWLKSAGELDNAGGFAYLADLARGVPFHANVRAYADIVRDKALLRAIISVTVGVQAAAFQAASGAGRGVVEDALQQFFKLETRGTRGLDAWKSLKHILKDVLEDMDKRSASSSALLGYSTGLSDLDQVIPGLEKSKLYLIGGRPGQGKTTLGMTICENVALEGGQVAIFSQEMPSLSLGQKTVASQGRADFNAVRRPHLLDEAGWAGVTRGVTKIANTAFYVDDSAGLSPADIRARLRRLVMDTGRPVDLVMIDYVGLMVPSGGKDHGSENANITNISRELMAIKKEFEVPILLLSQLNREVEKRGNRRPVLSDLRDSGSLEQDADVVMFLYRDEYYDQQSAEKGVAEIIVAKQRAGEIGTVKAAFSGKFQRFDDLAAPHLYAVGSDEGGGRW